MHISLRPPRTSFYSGRTCRYTGKRDVYRKRQVNTIYFCFAPESVLALSFGGRTVFLVHASLVILECDSANLKITPSHSLG
ncbi:hypothetical protein GALMADRAFT_1315631 [Galerina marginata CBS 339.88]|uniref:Uncharacterized protein n=1 Tax=Galerina marginata (strain CBS 339.88) TaxID=685588 RepID=A0A067T7K8_GALM3|nr:hypothetical protein GALMADRAFT_1315631 [Galerina marginata CBS 339.88]